MNKIYSVESKGALYLSGFSEAADSGLLQENNILRVLSVTTEVAKGYFKLELPNNVTHKVLDIDDDEEELLMEHFDECYGFIMEGLQNGGVLVHCMAGISRSATVVSAFVMKLNGWSADKAISFVKESRGFISPNDGFYSQLKLYYLMKYSLEGESKFHQRYKLMRLAYLRVKGKLKAISASNPAKPHTAYCCNTCNQVLFYEEHIVHHAPLDYAENECEGSEFFVEPMDWMSNVISRNSGDLRCLGCEQILGSFSWGGKKCVECNAIVYPCFEISKEFVFQCALKK